jgi:hypothetical protein
MDEETSKNKKRCSAVTKREKKGISMLGRQGALRGGLVAVAMGLLMALGLSATASAHSGEFAKFNYCPSTTSGVAKCLYSVTNGGTIVLGKKTTPIENPVTLQGGYSATNKEKKRISTFVGATNGVTLSKTPQSVPGGLAGLVNCKAIENFFERIACELVFENGVTGVNATLELAKPASEIEISEYNLLAEEGLALKLPVKVHLENPFLGSSCYVGSSSSPLIWNLTTGETSSSKPITGSAGFAELLHEAEIAQLTGNVLVDNTWSAPGASGCGEAFAFAVDPVINFELGLPASAGENSATLKNTIDIATVGSVNSH